MDGLNKMDELSWVLLCIRKAPKEVLGCCSVELVYRLAIMVHGDFVRDVILGPNPAKLLPSLRDKMQGLKPIPTTRHRVTKKSVPPDLAKATHMVIQNNTHVLRLQ